MSSTIRLGIDTGGTFTDLLRLDARGIAVYKLRSVPANPAEAILAGMQVLLADAEAGQPVEVTHGSTVATNALLERKGARVALITTQGFEDVLLIGRQTRAALYDFMVEARRPLVEPGMTFGAAERMLADGSVLEALSEEHVTAIVADLKRTQADSVAVCLLHSYANAAHEVKLTEALTAAGFAVSASHEILPEYREFERWSTTAVNAYVTPLMARYLATLEEGMQVAHPGARLRIMQSNGGSISAGRARAAAVQTILSGPAAGVVGAQAVGAASGYTKLITFDMGGTSTDVALIDGAIGTTVDSTVGDFPVRLPVLDIHTVGAGGGSVVWIDQGGSLRVGPRSAGADPGPACYGKGDELTVTDANLLLGRLDPQYFLGGRMALDLARARRIAAALAGRAGMSERALIEGVVRIANANMERAIRVVSVERGHDPRGFAMLAFGGAGGLHATEMAASLRIATVLVPEHSGVLSAMGMLLADVTKDYTQSLLKTSANVPYEQLEGLFVTITDRAIAALDAEGFSRERMVLEATLDMRYKGQAYELAVPLTKGFEAEFHRRHLLRYGYASDARATEIVNLRVKASGITDKPALGNAACEPRHLPAPTHVRPALFGRRSLNLPAWHREVLAPGMQGEGPAMIVSGQSTTIVSPGWQWRIDGICTLVASADATAGGKRAR